MNTVITKTKNEYVDLKKIKELCNEKGLSIAELGRRIGLPMRDQIHRRLKNQYTLTADEVFLIADELGVSAEELRLV